MSDWELESVKATLTDTIQQTGSVEEHVCCKEKRMTAKVLKGEGNEVKDERMKENEDDGGVKRSEERG